MDVRGLRKKRIAGLGLLGVLLGLFIGFNRFPKLDIVRDDLAAVSGPSAQCFQGFCINTGQSLLARWWEFSITYMELVAPGMVFAFLVAGLTAAFLFPQGVRLSSSGGVWGAIKGLAVGTPLSLCSACIVPITRALRGSGASISTTLGVVQGSATLNVPALLMVALIFTPLLGGSRIPAEPDGRAADRAGRGAPRRRRARRDHTLRGAAGPGRRGVDGLGRGAVGGDAGLDAGPASDT